VKCSLIEEYVKKPSAHGISTFNRSNVNYLKKYLGANRWKFTLYGWEFDQMDKYIHYICTPIACGDYNIVVDK
jgi:hypothetical protein